MIQERSGTVAETSPPHLEDAGFVAASGRGTFGTKQQATSAALPELRRRTKSDREQNGKYYRGVTTNPVRRLRGFVIDMRENQARVGFVGQDGKVVQYLLPEKNLRKAGITAMNQPFEMDEIEQEIDGAFFTGHIFRPMAPAEAVVTDTFAADDKLTELRNAALRHFGGKPKD